MSAFIGPIHYWLYRKIRLVGEREEWIAQKARETCGATAEELREQVIQMFGAPLPDIDLAELIDHDNIHGWLQRQIKTVETREAAFIKEVRDACGNKAMDGIDQAFFAHGKQTGEKAKQQNKVDLTAAPGIYQALNDDFLNGMPCDQCDQVVVSERDRVIWESDQWLQEPNWQRAGMDSKIMANLYGRWLTGYVIGANDEFEFKQVSDRLAGDARNRYAIHRKGQA
ncbi:hypothetical protein [Heliophilum fasciatum]|uniref:Uncharacterized protein n=1 Tax=Heliophilum fasciatum TaxID=35700 RepID=A0A4R2RNR4_9FIRM|nr:hypothetical protein [Heliophilum fasciatum]MCW2277850.1 hypothetical protein [Heliophilum fasciatum]TCP64658.1 hypothetical protein EDD73_10811 [Heliophilum fasciatum]